MRTCDKAYTLRKRLGLSQDEFCQFAGMNSSYYKLYEQGRLSSPEADEIVSKVYESSISKEPLTFKEKMTIVHRTGASSVMPAHIFWNLYMRKCLTSRKKEIAKLIKASNGILTESDF